MSYKSGSSHGVSDEGGTDDTSRPGSNANLNNISRQPRLCHVIKRADFDGYGFNLHAERGKPGQYIGKVDANSPAEAAGLREGDRIIEVNSISIGNETHKQVVQSIKTQPNEVKLLVIDPDVELIKDYQLPNQTKSTTSSSLLSSDTVADTSTTSVNKTLPTLKNNQLTDNDKSFAQTDNSFDKISIEKSSLTKTTTNRSGQNTSQLSSPASIESDNKLHEHSKNGKSATTNLLTFDNNGNTGSTGGNDADGLNLKMTAAELRAKLAAKKKYDPKNDTVDLKIKYDIIQKL